MPSPNAIKPRDIYITNSVIDPPVMKIAHGQDVTWINNDPVPHTVPPYGTVSAYGMMSHTFPTVGEYPYTLDGKPELTGTVSVS